MIVSGERESERERESLNAILINFLCDLICCYEIIKLSGESIVDTTCWRNGDKIIPAIFSF
jgi:hypothetical protein